MTERDAKRAASFVQGVVKELGPSLHRYLLKRLRAGEDAQDIAQEVYLRLLRLERSDLIRQPAAYVYFIAAQIVGEQRMREAKRPVVYDSELLEHAAERGNAVDLGELADRENATRELERLMRKLSSVHRTVFLMRKRDGYSNDEISKELGISLFKVKRYLVEANAILESKMRKEAL